MRCFACDTSSELAAGERVGFRDTCDGCAADLHCCCNCQHHDPAAHNQCREPNTEWVSERERSNHCEYFAPSDRGGGQVAKEVSAAKAQLDTLFKK
jgi:hypothetical protein